MIVAWVLDVTVGAVKPPDAEMTPIVLLQFTALVAEPLAKALHWLLCRDWMAAGVQVTVMVVSGVTVTVALAFMVEVCTEVAVMVTVSVGRDRLRGEDTVLRQRCRRWIPRRLRY